MILSDAFGLGRLSQSLISGSSWKLKHGIYFCGRLKDHRAWSAQLRVSNTDTHTYIHTQSYHSTVLRRQLRIVVSTHQHWKRSTTMALPIREIKPKNARTKRYLDNKAPQVVEKPRTTLFLRYTTSSEVLSLVMKDLHSIKRPLCVKFDKKNSIHPFEDPSSLEFFADKNDASLMLYASHSKKRPHALTLVRMFDYKVLNMLELLVDPDTFRSLSQFKNAKAAVGLKPLLSFSGSGFESPIANEYTLAKSVLLDLFKGPDAGNVDVEGLQYMIHFSVDEEDKEGVKPQIHMRCYLIRTQKVGEKLPKVELEEMGPRIDFRVGRVHESNPDMMKEAMRRPKTTEVSMSVEALLPAILLTLDTRPSPRRTSKQTPSATKSVASIWVARICLSFRPGR